MISWAVSLAKPGNRALVRRIVLTGVGEARVDWFDAGTYVCRSPLPLR